MIKLIQWQNRCVKDVEQQGLWRKRCEIIGMVENEGGNEDAG